MPHDASIRRIVSFAAAVLTAVVVVLPPSIYFVVSYNYAAGLLQAEAEINARIVTRIVGANPDLWQFESVRLSEYLSRRPRQEDAERRRVVDRRGTVVAESADPLPRPWVTRSVPLYDAGEVVGAIEISRSARPLLFRSGVLGAAMLLVALLSFRSLRTVPLRAVRRSEDALRRERDNAQRYLDVAGVAFVILDEAGRVARVNRKGAELLGRPEAEIVGRDWLAGFVDPADRERVASRTAAGRDGDVLALEYGVLRPGGERRSVAWYVTHLLDPDGRAAGLLASGVDLTAQRKLEAQLRTAQRFEAIGALAGGVAHDFNNVLSLIKGNAVLLRRRVGEEEPQRRHVDDILASVDRAAALTGTLLAFGRRRTLHAERLDLAALVRGFEPSLRRLLRDDVDLRCAVPTDPLPVLAERLELERVLMNLVTNAQDAMPEGGPVIVSATRTDLDADGATAAGLAAPGPYAQLVVADAGVGIAPDVQARLFEPFFTTKDLGKGTGLGLSIAYAIMRQHLGTIRVASEPGHGTTFTLLLPLLAEPLAVAAGPGAGGETPAAAAAGPSR